MRVAAAAASAARVAADLIVTAPNYYNYLNYKPTISFQMPEKVMVSENRNIDKPNVYLLIPDAFPPNRSLKNIFEETYENPLLLKILLYSKT